MNEKLEGWSSAIKLNVSIISATGTRYCHLKINMLGHFMSGNLVLTLCKFHVNDISFTYFWQTKT